MILHDLPPGTTLIRARTPQWASRPTGGAGAASRGGRFNREGIEALSLSLDEVTALRDHPQTSPFPPVLHDVFVHRVAARLGRSVAAAPR